MYEIGEREIQALARVVRSGQLFRYRGGEGGECDSFERELCAKLGARHSLLMTSGTSALICALAGMGIGPGDEVIVPAYTFMASPLAVLAVGAVPVLAEVDASLLIDPRDVARKITRRTKAIMPVHMLGLPCNLGAIARLARKHKIAVLEDACQAVGGSYRGRRLTTIGDAGAFSFNHFKIITCGEGGALVTSNRRIYERALMQHDGGCAFRSHAGRLHEPIFTGQTMRASEFLGAIMRVQLQRLDGILARLRARKAVVVKALAGCGACTLSPVHDVAGDCGVGTAVQLDSAKRLRPALAALKAAGVPCMSPIDSGMHVYSNWEPILAQRASHHPRLNPFHLTDHKYVYTPDMCPATTDVLSRTIFLSTPFDATLPETRGCAQKARQAIESV